MSNPLFTSIPLPKVSRNTFKLSHSNKYTMTAQKNYPTLIMEGLPGDRNLVFAECLARALPMVAPVYQSYSISHHAFFVPMRTLSKNWEQFITGGKDGTYSSMLPFTTYGAIYSKILTIKSAYAGTATYGSVTDAYKFAIVKLCDVIRMLDFAGLSFAYQSVTGNIAPASSTPLSQWSKWAFVQTWLTNNSSYSGCDVPVNLLPFVAMLKIWDEYYRDENIVDSQIDYIATLGLDTAIGFQNISTWTTDEFCALFMMRPRAWKKDRFTSALPFTQRGPDVLLPIAGTAPVTFGTSTPSAGSSVVTGTTDAAGDVGLSISVGGGARDITAAADFDNATLETTINDFRRAERLQRWYENSARGGSRLNENTLAHWGVHTPDSTLDRAVFLGGVNQPLVISEVEQNSGTASGTTPQGTLAGKGTSYNSGRLFKHYDSEHGYTIVFTSILQHGDYMQGTPRVFTRQDRYEYAWPEFANLGEEAIKTRELYTLAGNDEVFGYTPRYSDYKSMPNEIHGDMRTSLRFWSLPRIFGNKPALNEEFIYNPPSKEAFAVTSGETDEFVVVTRFAIKSSRLLPFYGVPTI